MQKTCVTRKTQGRLTNKLIINNIQTFKLVEDLHRHVKFPFSSRSSVIGMACRDVIEFLMSLLMFAVCRAQASWVCSVAICTFFVLFYVIELVRTTVGLLRPGLLLERSAKILHLPPLPLCFFASACVWRMRKVIVLGVGNEIFDSCMRVCACFALKVLLHSSVSSLLSHLFFCFHSCSLCWPGWWPCSISNFSLRSMHWLD